MHKGACVICCVVSFIVVCLFVTSAMYMSKLYTYYSMLHSLCFDLYGCRSLLEDIVDCYKQLNMASPFPEFVPPPKETTEQFCQLRLLHRSIFRKH